jgi:hypothetical protein
VRRFYNERGEEFFECSEAASEPNRSLLFLNRREQFYEEKFCFVKENFVCV